MSFVPLINCRGQKSFRSRKLRKNRGRTDTALGGHLWVGHRDDTHAPHTHSLGMEADRQHVAGVGGVVENDAGVSGDNGGGDGGEMVGVVVAR